MCVCVCVSYTDWEFKIIEYLEKCSFSSKICAFSPPKKSNFKPKLANFFSQMKHANYFLGKFSGFNPIITHTKPTKNKVKVSVSCTLGHRDKGPLSTNLSSCTWKRRHQFEPIFTAYPIFVYHLFKPNINKTRHPDCVISVWKGKPYPALLSFVLLKVLWKYVEVNNSIFKLNKQTMSRLEKETVKINERNLSWQDSWLLTRRSKVRFGIIRG